MDQNLEALIRERAYEIWTSRGCVHGQADQHWLAAEREILTASTAALAGKPGLQKSRRVAARSKGTKALRRGGQYPRRPQGLGPVAGGAGGHQEPPTARRQTFPL